MRRPSKDRQLTVFVPRELHPATAALIQTFAEALSAKLKSAQEKYGYRDGWRTQDWEAECRRHLIEHIAKGDPLDVAAYCAFMWKRGWSTAEKQTA